MEIIVRPGCKEVSQRKLEVYSKYAEIIQWGRKYPINFASRFFGIELLDFQSYILSQTWTADFALWLACRNAGKSTMIAIYAMLRSLLLPFHSTYIIGNSGGQAKETFSKIEKIVKKEIESFVGSTDVFFDEITRNGPTGDGFTHSPESFAFKLFNGSTVNTLNSDPTNIKGKRAGLVLFD